MTDCIFCKIIQKQIPSELVHEDDICVVFKDIHPKKPVHFLLVPRKHIPTIADMEEGDEKIVGHLVCTAKEMGSNMGLKGYQLTFNVGKEGGQEIFHLHLHLLANTPQ